MVDEDIDRTLSGEEMPSVVDHVLQSGQRIRNIRHGMGRGVDREIRHGAYCHSELFSGETNGFLKKRFDHCNSPSKAEKHCSWLRICKECRLQ